MIAGHDARMGRIVGQNTSELDIFDVIGLCLRTCIEKVNEAVEGFFAAPPPVQQPIPQFQDDFRPISMLQSGFPLQLTETGDLAVFTSGLKADRSQSQSDFPFQLTKAGDLAVFTSGLKADRSPFQDDFRSIYPMLQSGQGANRSQSQSDFPFQLTKAGELAVSESPLRETSAQPLREALVVPMAKQPTGIKFKPQVTTYCAQDSIVNPNAQQVDAIVAIGPGGIAFGAEMLERITRTFGQNEDQIVKSSLLVGNGIDAICIDSIIEAVKIAKKNQRPISLFIQAHGVIEGGVSYKYGQIMGGEHCIVMGNDVLGSSRELFKKIKDVLGDEYPHPLSIFMTSCYGGGAIPVAASELPKNTTFVALCGRSDCSSGRYVEPFLDKMKPSSWSSGIGLLYDYLITSGSKRGPFMLYGSEEFSLHDLLRKQYRKSFSIDEKAQAHQILDDLMGGTEEVDRIINKIERPDGRGEDYWDWDEDYWDEDYGRAFAVVLATKDPRFTKIAGKIT